MKLLLDLRIVFESLIIARTLMMTLQIPETGFADS